MSSIFNKMTNKESATSTELLNETDDNVNQDDDYYEYSKICPCNGDMNISCKIGKFDYCAADKDRTCNLRYQYYKNIRIYEVLLPEKHIPHEYNGAIYKCEDCYKYGCHECLYGDVDDDFGARLEDGIFLCRNCYLAEIRRLDRG